MQANASIETYDFDTASQEKRFRTLSLELRCPKCQNQAIGDSDAEISKDLRSELYRMLKQGASDAEIKKFMVARYGRYVLYKPPLDSQTTILWFGPGVLLVLGGLVVFCRIRRSKQALINNEQSL